LRGILDEHSKSIQSSKLTRKRNYDDTLYFRNDPPPSGLPDWAYASSDEEKKQKKGKGKAKESATAKPKRRRITDYEQSIMYSEGEEHQTGESATTGEIRGAITREKKKKREKDLEGFVVSDSASSSDGSDNPAE